ncbi:DUF3108 domain-containing protein [bacterium]|nr:DUF3108 domain-containing protein [bacterium]
MRINKRTITVLAAILLIALFIPSGLTSQCDSITANQSFGIGERLEFGVYLGFINAGTAIMEVADVVEIRGHLCYHLRSIASSNATVSLLYQVNDLVESFMDVEKLFSRRYEKHLSEGNYRADKTVSFDQEAQLAIYPDDTLQIMECTQDALSALYFLRNLNLTVGDTIPIPNHESKKNYSVAVIVHGKETIEVPAGRFDCIIIEPVLMAAGIFKHQGRLKVWLTDDDLKIPVLMKSKIPVGSVNAKLLKYKLGEKFEW